MVFTTYVFVPIYRVATAFKGMQNYCVTFWRGGGVIVIKVSIASAKILLPSFGVFPNS